MHKYLITILIIGLSLLLHAQESERKNEIVTHEGKIYINKKTPLYLFISSSSDSDAKYINMESTKENKYANPFYMDTEGHNTFYPGNATYLQKNNRKIYMKKLILDVYADGIAPTTSYKLYKARSSYSNGKQYYKAGIKIRLRAYDAISGVKAIYFKINDGELKEYNDKITLEQSGSYEILYYAIDLVDNKEKLKKRNINIK